ncbi:MAG: thiamine-phosphate kinase [Alphaproteobacteria bacterium]
MDEFERIARWLSPLADGEPGAYGLKDDAAVLAPEPGYRLVVTTDLIAAGVHFFADDDPALVARRLLRVNLSDLAAMGATPRGYLLGLALPRATDESWLARFASGLKADQEAFDIGLVGGDMIAVDGPLTLMLTALGQVRPGEELSRAGARPGDVVFVSGTVGDAALGLRALEGGLAGLDGEARDILIGRFRLPRPRLELGRCLAGVASAAIDVSDGLVADLAHICACSHVAAVVEAQDLALSEAGKAALLADPALLELALTGGDDYEILFAAPSSSAPRVEALARELGLRLTPIGRFSEGEGVEVRDPQGRPIHLARPGYRHF